MSANVFPLSGLIYGAQNCTVCRKDFTADLSSGAGQALILSTLIGSGLIPCLWNTFPNQVTSGWPSLHFSLRKVMPYSCSLCSTASSLLSCSLPTPCMQTSSLICTTPCSSCSTLLSLAWHSAEAACAPITSLLNLNRPKGVVNLNRSLELSASLS